MLRRSFYLPIILLCSVLFTGNGAKAQDIFSPEGAPVPPQARGNWVIPDCASYDEGLLLTRRFYLKATASDVKFYPAALLKDKKDYWVLSIEGKKHPVHREADGVLKIIAPPEKPTELWPDKWDALHPDSRREYMGCKDIPSILPDPMVRVMLNIDTAAATCRSEISGTCTRLLFDIADDNKDKKLSLIEMEMAGVMLSGLAALIETPSMDRTALDAALYAGLAEAEKIAPTLMKKKDGLAYGDFSGFLSKIKSDLLRESLTSVGKILPAFGKM